MTITKEEAIKILSRYDTEYYTPATRLAHRMAAEALREQEVSTNADWVRAMSDEELAKKLNQLTDSYPGVCRELPECHADLEADNDIPLERCEGCWAAWLQQPAKEVE